MRATLPQRARAGKGSQGAALRPRPDPTGTVAKFPCYAPLLTAPGVVLLPHPNESGGDALHPLDEGDVVCSCYAAFVFGWPRARPS
jgi:hypothetical protein